MNEELIRQCAREVRAKTALDKNAAGKIIAGEMDDLPVIMQSTEAIRLYHARAVAPLVEALEGFVSDLTGGGKNGEKWLSISHDALVARIQQARAALAAFGKGEE